MAVLVRASGRVLSVAMGFRTRLPSMADAVFMRCLGHALAALSVVPIAASTAPAARRNTDLPSSLQASGASSPAAAVSASTSLLPSGALATSPRGDGGRLASGGAKPSG
jgi:hypothetical protein